MDQYTTELSPEDETAFIMWFFSQKKEGKIHQDDSGQDYDFRGFWNDYVKNKEDNTFSSETHYPDTYKKPNHPTFSVESKYATGADAVYAGYWDKEDYVPSLIRYIPDLVDTLRSQIGGI